MERSPDHPRETLLETDRLLLRPWRVSEAAVQREMWTERDLRVPPHRRIDADGRPTVEEIEGWVLGWARAAGYRRLWATVRDWNGASRQVLAKLGFVESGRVEADAVHGDSLFLTKRL